MNFLFYAPQMAPYGGMERHVCSLAAAAAGRGHQVTLLTTSNSLGPELRAGLEAAQVVLRELPAARNAAGRLAKLRWLLGEIARARGTAWDVIYTNGQGALARMVWHARRGSTRCIHHHHTAADAGEQATWSGGFRRVLEQAPELVACSQATRDALNAATGRRDTRFLPYLTRCPVEASQVAERPRAGALRFGFLGRLIPEKGIDALCRLSTDPALTGITWHLHGAGPAYPPGCFAAWPGIVAHGAFASGADQARALQALDAVVLFSIHNEGMPLSLIEAMSAGCPWIATDRGGTRELALSPANAIVVPHPADDAALRAAVLDLAGRIREGRTSRRVQREAYDAHFSPAVVAARWLPFLESGSSALAAA